MSADVCPGCRATCPMAELCRDDVAAPVADSTSPGAAGAGPTEAGSSAATEDPAVSGWAAVADALADGSTGVTANRASVGPGDPGAAAADPMNRSHSAVQPVRAGKSATANTKSRKRRRAKRRRAKRRPGRPDEMDAAARKRIIELREDQGLSYARIARRMTDEGWFTTRSLTGRHPWAPSTIGRVLERHRKSKEGEL